MRRMTPGAIVTVAYLAIPQAAHACAVCFDANGEVRMAFIITTIFLTFLPLSMVGGVALWMRKRFREMGDVGEELIN